MAVSRSPKGPRTTRAFPTLSSSSPKLSLRSTKLAAVERHDSRLIAPQGLYGRIAKRFIDVLLASAALVVLLPALLFIALTIRLGSRGPALFRQTRIGRDGRPFTIYKFRTMKDSPGKNIQWLADENGTARHKLRNDPRITRVGRWLRRTSADELPQLINVVLGDMSLIGPRPELPEIVDGYEPWQHRRHLVRPGLTGWWQVNGRSNRPMHENTELDLYYVENLSFWVDLKIVIRTFRVVAKGLGAF